jgi:hypothetical protein
MSKISADVRRPEPWHLIQNQFIKIFCRYPNATPHAKFVDMRRYPKMGVC